MTEGERHQLSIMGIEGHAEIVWSVHDFDSIKNAKAMFDKLTGDGFQAFAVKRTEDAMRQPSKGGKITKFDPALEEVIMVPKVSGG